MPFSRLASVGATRSLLEEFGLTAKYQLGQNFLVNDDVIGRILELANLAPDDVVVEVGPGIGTLTSAMLPKVAAVVAVEADRDMQGPLSVSCADYSERLALVFGDALKVTPQQLGRALADLRQASSAQASGGHGPHGSAHELPNCWVANLPYAVAATLVLKWFESPDWTSVERACVMVQSEVADRISAGPGTKIYGAYTLKLQLHARVTGRFQVPASCFFPAPHVESAVVAIERLPESERMAPEDARWCAEVIDAAFSQRRKTIRNAMSGCSFATKERLDAAFAEADIAPSARAETLVLDDFKRLAAALAQA